MQGVAKLSPTYWPNTSFATRLWHVSSPASRRLCPIGALIRTFHHVENARVSVTDSSRSRMHLCTVFDIAHSQGDNKTRCKLRPTILAPTASWAKESKERNILGQTWMWQLALQLWYSRQKRLCLFRSRCCVLLPLFAWKRNITLRPGPSCCDRGGRTIPPQSFAGPARDRLTCNQTVASYPFTNETISLP